MIDTKLVVEGDIGAPDPLFWTIGGCPAITVEAQVRMICSLGWLGCSCVTGCMLTAIPRAAH
jgi:hypothetical protein